MADLLGLSETRKDMKGRRLFGEKKTVIPFSGKGQILTDGGIKLTEKQPLRQKKILFTHRWTNSSLSVLNILMGFIKHKNLTKMKLALFYHETWRLSWISLFLRHFVGFSVLERGGYSIEIASRSTTDPTYSPVKVSFSLLKSSIHSFAIVVIITIPYDFFQFCQLGSPGYSLPQCGTLSNGLWSPLPS